MSLNYYDVTVPIFIKNLNNVRALLERGFAHATETGMTEEMFLSQSLTPDMFHLKKQIQIVTDNAKGATARLTGTAPLSIEDIEGSVAELLARIDTVLTYLKSFKPEQFTQAADAKITLPFMPGQYQTGSDYVVDFALPNFFFHVSMVYAIIRVQGVPIGKPDFLGGLKLHTVS